MLLRITPSFPAGNRWLRIHLLLMMLAGQGCAYSLLGSEAPYQVRRIAVIPFAENVAVGISADLASALATRLAAHGLHLTTDVKTADAILSGTVLSGGSQGSPTPVGGVVGAYRLVANCVVTLTQPDGTVLWKSNFTFGEDFIAATDPLRPVLSTEANQRRAANRLAQSASYTIYQQMMMDSTFASIKRSEVALSINPEADPVRASTASPTRIPIQEPAQKPTSDADSTPLPAKAPKTMPVIAPPSNVLSAPASALTPAPKARKKATP